MSDHIVFLSIVFPALMTNHLELAFDTKSICHLGAHVIFLKTKSSCVSSLAWGFFCLSSVFKMNSNSLAGEWGPFHISLLPRCVASSSHLCSTTFPHPCTQRPGTSHSFPNTLCSCTIPSLHKCPCFLDFPFSVLWTLTCFFKPSILFLFMFSRFH